MSNEKQKDINKVSLNRTLNKNVNIGFYHFFFLSVIKNV